MTLDALDRVQACTLTFIPLTLVMLGKIGTPSFSASDITI